MDPFLNQLNQVTKDITLQKEKNLSLNIAPIFIIGVPRSGTTLLTQLLISSFELGYIDNISAKFWNNPQVGVTLSNDITPFYERIIAEYSSSFGFTKGPFGPHEFGYFWKRWFNYGDTHELDPEQLLSINQTEIKNTIDLLLNHFQIPFLFKNAVAITLQIEFIAKIFPEALFILSSREPIYNAQSLLQCRYKYSGSKNKWFSAKPKEYTTLKNLSIYDQVAGQVFYCEKKIHQVYKHNETRFINISYTKLCAQPQKIIETVADKFSNLEIHVRRKSNKIKNFINHNKIDLPISQFNELENSIHKFYGDEK